jgi:hypothetical protein
MHRWLLTGLSVLALAAASAAPAAAQYGPAGGGAPRPTTSPYLNLFRPGSAGLNYYQLVRPEFQVRRSINSIENNLNTITPLVTGEADAAAGLTQTGHPIQFNNLGRYFPASANRGPGAGPRFGGGTTPTAPVLGVAAATGGARAATPVRGGRR